MAHGDHWQAVEQDVQIFIDTMIALICKEGRSAGEADATEGVVFGIQYPMTESPVSFLALAVRQDHDEKKVIRTAYPVCAEGPCTRLVIDEVKPWASGLEGSIEAYMPEGDSVCFFDPFFFLNREKYQEWAEIDVALSALAYLLEKADPDQADPAVDPGSDSAIDELPPEPDESPAGYYPCGEYGDSAEIEFVVEEVIPVACIGRLFWRMTGVIMRSDNALEMSIHVYASEQVLKGYAPQPGDHVLAVAWLQGRLLRVAQSS